MKKNWFKNLFIPSGEKTTVVAYKSWTVRWVKITSEKYSNYFIFNYIPQAEIFPSEIDANKFADQLREAFKLLHQNGAATKVVVESNQLSLAELPQLK